MADTDESKELTREQQLAIEEGAINALLQMGVKISVPLNNIPIKKAPWRIRWWNKHFTNHAILWRNKKIPKDWNVSVKEIADLNTGRTKECYVRNFHIKPLFLGTIQVLRSLYIEIEYNEEEIQAQPLMESKKLFKYVPLMALIAAVAVINDPSVADPTKSKRVKDLQKFFMEYLTVTRLQTIANVVSQMMNPGGFTSSIRLIMGVGITKPKPIRADLVE